MLFSSENGGQDSGLLKNNVFFIQRPKPDEKYYSSSIWGPTCDGLDRIVERCNLPEMHVGDWMLIENMGAYTVAASTFNGFQRPNIYYVMSRPMW
jgi:ornithine decarboxylase